MSKLLFLLAVLYLLPLKPASASLEPDHLLPVHESSNRLYTNLLRRKLETTPFDCGRIVVRPPFTGEYSISIYAEAQGSHGTQYHITMRSARQSLWQASSGGVEPARANGIKIEQTDVAITPELAMLLREVLTKMIAGTRKLSADEQPGRVVAEGAISEVMIKERNDIIKAGRLGDFPPRTPNLSLLARLVNELSDLCKAPSSQVVDLTVKVTQTAKALEQRLR